MKTTKPLLTISLLISNRPDTIPKCLDSLKPIMEAIPSELILIDTSKSEEIHNLLLTYTDKVYTFEWCKDFAKARNEGVRRAKGEWFLFIDDDEWFVDVEELIDFFRTGKYKKYEYAAILIRNFTDVEFTKYSDVWCKRLFYLGEGVRFEGVVHEDVYGLYGDATYINAKAYHSGYVFDTEEKRRAHFERNEQLLLKALEEAPEDLRLIAHLVQEYRSVEDWHKLILVCKEELSKVKELSSYSDKNHLGTLYVGIVEAYTHLKQYKNALQFCELGLNDERTTELLKSLLHMYTAQIYVDIKEWDKANAHICQYFEGYEYFLNHKESTNIQLAAALVHRVFDEDFLGRASNTLVYSALKKNNITIPFAINDEVLEDKIDMQKVLMYIKEMVKLMISTKYKGVFTDFLNLTVRNSELCRLICAEVIQVENKDEEAFQRIAYEFSKVESNFWYICYCRIVEADSRESKADVEAAIEALLKELQIVCHMPDRVYGIIDRYDIKIALLWDKVVGEEWTGHARNLVYNSEDIYIDKAYGYLLNVYEETDWRVEVLVSAFQEKMLQAQRQEEMEVLRTQALEQVQTMLAAGMKQEASQIIAQLKMMFPGDEEIENMLK